MLPKYLLCALVALSLALAGTPVLAAKEMPCPMPESTQVQSMPQSGMAMEHCDDCPEMTKAQKKKGDDRKSCCDDAACNAKCATTTSFVPLFSSGTFEWFGQSVSHNLGILPDFLLPSRPGNTPERPPKNLS